MEIIWYCKTAWAGLLRWWTENGIRLSVEEWWLNQAIVNVDFSLHQTLSLRARLREESIVKGESVEIPFDEESSSALAKFQAFLREKGSLRKALNERREDVRELRALRIVDKTRRRGLNLGVISLPQPTDDRDQFYMFSRVTGELRLNAEGLKKVWANIRDERAARLEPLARAVELISKLSPVIAGLLGYLLGTVLGG